MTCERFAEFIIGGATAVGTLLAAIYAGQAASATRDAVKEQVRQAKAMLWRSLDQEFNSSDRREQRRKCADIHLNQSTKEERAYRFKHVLDFLETVAFLIVHGQLDEVQAKHTFWNVMSGYFEAGQLCIDELQDSTTDIYSDIRRLMGTDRWGLAPEVEDNLQEFFREEWHL